VPPLWRFYRRHLCQQAVQPFRWVEYSFSASCLFLVGLAIDGATDFYHVILTFVAMWTVMMMGLLQELGAYYLRRIEQLSATEEKYKRNLVEFFLPHLIGWVPYMVLWYEALDRFNQDMQHIKPNAPPHWVVGFYVFNFIVFSSFGFTQLVEMVALYRLPATVLEDGKLRNRLVAEAEKRAGTKITKFGDFENSLLLELAVQRIAVRADYAYTVLSLVAKSVSGYFLLSGLIASSDAAHY